MPIVTTVRARARITVKRVRAFKRGSGLSRWLRVGNVCVCVCVLRKVQVRRSRLTMLAMRAGLRWPHGPFQVILSAAVLLTLAFSLQFGFAGCGGAWLRPDSCNLGSREHLNTNAIAMVSGNPNATYLTICFDLSAMLENGDNFRMLPVIEKSGWSENLRRLLPQGCRSQHNAIDAGDVFRRNEEGV